MFFFFQAEDGIRDLTVTGVQTCALPISLRLTPAASDFLVERGYDEHFGARPLKRAIQKYVEDPLSEKILIGEDRKSTRLNSSHSQISYAVFCLKKKKQPQESTTSRTRRS